MMHIQGVGKRFMSRGAWVTGLESVDLKVQTGEFLTIVGPSGCGKSTLLNIVAGLFAAPPGQVPGHGTKGSRGDRGTR